MVCLLAAVIMLSWALTWFLRRYALANNIMDIPNQRSSHCVPTPRGGGLAFVASFLITIPFLEYQGYVLLSESIALMGAGLFIAALGFLDDHAHIDARWRLIGHFVASSVAVFWLGGMPSVSIFSWILSAGLLLNVMAVMYLVWLLNLYNFMDGIDGLAGIEALSVCIGAAGLYWVSGAHFLMAVPLVLAASVTGFLYWNLPPARIFMGDAGSGFLGFILGVLSILSAGVHAEFFWSWLILLGVFIIDATITLLRRGLRGAKVYEAHRTHAYQHASSRFDSHYPVTIIVLMINVLWLCPMAVLVGLGYVDGFFGLLIAYLPLVVLAVFFRAGKEKESAVIVSVEKKCSS